MAETEGLDKNEAAPAKERTKREHNYRKDGKASRAKRTQNNAEAKARAQRAAGSATPGSKGGGKNSRPKLLDNDRRNVWLLVLMTVLLVVSVVLFTPPGQKINQGLDIQGGLSVVLTATSTDGSDDGAISAENLEKSRAIIENRVNALGASETVVQTQGDNQILVQIPGETDAERALAAIGQTGKLEFARLDSFTDEKVRNEINSGQYETAQTVTDDFGNSFQTGTTSHLKVPEGTYTPIVTGENITKVTVDRESETSTNYAVNVTLDSAGSEAFAQASRDLVGDHGKIVIILDGVVQSAPAVQSVIDNGNVSITGGYTLDDAKALQTILESGSLPVSFSYSQSSVVGPTLGQGALVAGVLVALIGLLLVMLYLLFFYRGLGAITAAAVAVFGCLYLGILAGLSALGLFSLSLAGIAGIVLTIGMAADSSVLTLERFREEIRMGRSVKAASITGVRHAIQTSIDADLVSLVSALCLFFLASASVKGFGMTLALGIFCDIVMMLIFKAPLIRLLAPRSIAKHPKFWGIDDSLAASEKYEELATIQGQMVDATVAACCINPDESERIAESRAGAAGKAAMDAVRGLKGRFIKKDIPFMEYRKYFLIFSAVLVALAIGVCGVKGLNFGIEFVGGSSITYSQANGVSSDELRAAFAKNGEDSPVIQTTKTNGEDGFLVRITETDPEKATTLANDVATDLGMSTSTLQVETIGPDWGSSVVQASLVAFLVSLLLIIVYIAIRFEFRMGIIAVVALLHDLIIVVGVYALVGRELNPNAVAALLTIIGYSLYDTVVVFHRINENMSELDVRCSFMTMANHSLNQVILRTLNTTLTSLIPVLAMLLFGGETLKDFAFAMVIGLLAGSYSSIGVATPLFAMWKTRSEEYAKLVKRYGEKLGNFTFKQPFKQVVIPKGAAAAAVGADQGQTAGMPDLTVVVEDGSAVAEKIKAGPQPAKGGGKQPKQKSNHHYRRKKK